MSLLNKPVALYLMRAYGSLHLGNYLGALKNWIAMVNDYECFIGMADMHAITENYKPAILRKDTINILAQYLASGLVAEKSHFFSHMHQCRRNSSPLFLPAHYLPLTLSH